MSMAVPVGLAPPEVKKNLRPLQQRNTLSMRSSIFQVQYTLHWAGGASSTLLPLQTNSV